MRLIKLDINYDPDLPDWMQGPCEPPPQEPRFFKFRSGRVKLLGVNFFHRHVSNKRDSYLLDLDPYSGQSWCANFLGFRLTISDFITPGFRLRFRSRLVYTKTAYQWKKMPWLLRQLWDFLEDRRSYYDYFQASPPSTLDYYQ